MFYIYCSIENIIYLANVLAAEVTEELGETDGGILAETNIDISHQVSSFVTTARSLLMLKTNAKWFNGPCSNNILSLF